MAEIASSRCPPRSGFGGGIICAEIYFFDGDDYILHTNEDMLDRAVAIMREAPVGVILTHTRDDPGNLPSTVKELT